MGFLYGGIVEIDQICAAGRNKFPRTVTVLSFHTLCFKSAPSGKEQPFA
jgi:hypothetical protein